jgi:hypothetical protein
MDTAAKYTLWIFWGDDGRAALGHRLEESLRGVGGVEAALWHLPDRVADPCLGHMPSARAILQLYLDSLESLQRGLQAGSDLWRALQRCDPEAWPAGVSIQAMKLSVQSGRRPDGPACAYVVGYEGDGDGREWVRRYCSEHVDLMLGLPGIRQIEVYVQASCAAGWPVPVRRWLLRNKAVFDDAASLQAALYSPARLDMQRHRTAMPPLGGQSEHIAMRAVPLSLS